MSQATSSGSQSVTIGVSDWIRLGQTIDSLAADYRRLSRPLVPARRFESQPFESVEVSRVAWDRFAQQVDILAADFASRDRLRPWRGRVVKWASPSAWLAGGVSVLAIVIWSPWQAVYVERPRQYAPTWVATALLFTALVAALLAVLLYLLGHWFQRPAKADKDSVFSQIPMAARGALVVAVLAIVVWSPWQAVSAESPVPVPLDWVPLVFLGIAGLALLIAIALICLPLIFGPSKLSSRLDDLKKAIEGGNQENIHRFETEARLAAERDRQSKHLAWLLAAITTVLAILIALLAWAFPRQPETATAMVPGVTGLSEAKAIALLASKGFEAVPSFVLADGHSVGHVRAESPSAGTETAPSSAVAIEISQSAPPSAKVPPVAGLTEDQAVPLLLAKGFAVSTSYVKPDMQHSSGLVAAESPLGGSQAVPHSVVTIDVANSTPPFKYCKKLTTVG